MAVASLGRILARSACGLRLIGTDDIESDTSIGLARYLPVDRLAGLVIGREIDGVADSHVAALAIEIDGRVIRVREEHPEHVRLSGEAHRFAGAQPEISARRCSKARRTGAVTTIQDAQCWAS
ncbi:MAG: hypothetical protein ACT4O5_10755 [Gammaproteobacteria bacterium]